VSQGSPTEEFGPYLVYEQLGVGGMAQVHRAVPKSSDVRRPVALKRMLSHIASSEDMVKSFVREARLASYLRHQNVAETYDLGRVGEVYFIVMELITGRNLRAVLRHCGKTTGPMPVRIALNILNQICDALDYAHNLCDETGQPLGIIHRDVSPSNVIVSETGVAKLIDFGIAKASAAGMQTMSGTLKGKFAYMAPEYIAGRIDARADLFAVGVIAHELLTNRPLFSGRDDIDTLTRVRDMHIDPPSKKNPLVPPEIDDIVMTALARDPDRRWQHATALRSALTTLTRRLDLVATNAQMVQWLDWAFTQRAGAPRKADRTETDTETDAAPIGDEPSISMEENTAQLRATGPKATLVTGDPQPPTKTPAGTPAYVPAQRAIPRPVADRGSGPAITLRGAGLGARASTKPVAAPAARSSSTIPVRVVSPSSPPLAATAPLQPSSGRVNATFLAAPAPAFRATPAAVPTPPATGAPAVRPTPAGSPRLPTDSSGPTAPIVPAPFAAPFAAPRPRTASAGPGPAYDPARSAKVQREFAQRVSAPSTAASAGSSRVLGVVLLVLAAAIAAITVYFVLPLLT
jgi:serine/threonine protein kinase